MIDQFKLKIHLQIPVCIEQIYQNQNNISICMYVYNITYVYLT